jgi:uncharacterized protein (DUF305 family)
MALKQALRHFNTARRGSVAAVVVVLLAGCSGGDSEPQPAAETAPNIVQPGAPGESGRTLSADELAEIGETSYTDADVDFVQGMIHHHAQALRMTGLVPERSGGHGIPLLARRMEIAQEGEIELMQDWLKARGKPAPTVHREHGEAHGAGDRLMPGMLTDEQMDELEAAEGREFDRLFLRFMIQHHRGAVTMVRELYAADGGAEPEVDSLARHVEADQQIEIARMEQLLAELD